MTVKKNIEISKTSLPFYQGAIDEFEKAFLHRVKLLSKSSGLMSQARGFVVQEGLEADIVRDDVSTDQPPMRENQASVQLKYSEIERFNVESALKSINEFSSQFGAHQSRQLIETVDETTKITGNVLDAEGKSLSNELLLEMLERVEHDFTPGTRNSTLSLVVHPDMVPKLIKLDEEMKASPDLMRKYNELMVRKYEQFRDREMDRTLAG